MDLTLPAGLTMSPASLFSLLPGSSTVWRRVIAAGTLAAGPCLDITATMLPNAPGLAVGSLPVSLVVSAAGTIFNDKCGGVTFPTANFSNPTTIIGAPGTTTTTTAAIAAGLMPSGFVSSNTRIYGNLVVDNASILGGWSVLFSGADHRKGAGASITVNPSCILSLSNNAHFFNDCGLMWRGTTIQTGGTVRTGDFQFWGTTTTIEDAVAAFEMRNNSTLLSESAIYRRNFVGVFADLPVVGSINLPGFANNQFECTTFLNSPYPGQPALLGGLINQSTPPTPPTPANQRAFAGVVLRNVTATNFTNQIIGSYTQKNWFNTLRYGVYLLNCQNMLVLNNVYQHILRENFPTGGDAVYAENSGVTVRRSSSSDNSIFFDNCLNGVRAVNCNSLEVRNNLMTRVQRGVFSDPAAAADTHVEIHINQISCSVNGIELNGLDWNHAGHVADNHIWLGTLPPTPAPVENANAGISIVGNSVKSASLAVQANIIDGLSGNAGIALSDLRGCLPATVGGNASCDLSVNNNQIRMQNANCRFGLLTTNCQAIRVHENGPIEGPGALSIGNQEPIGLGISDCESSRFCCNSMVDFHTASNVLGANLGQPGYFTTLTGSIFGDYQVGLWYDPEVMIDIQEFRGNNWPLDFEAGTVGARHLGDVFLIPLQAYTIENPIGTEYWPPINPATGLPSIETTNNVQWFFPSQDADDFRCGGNTFDCGWNGGLAEIPPVFEQIAAGNLPISSGSAWLARYSLARTLTQNPGLLSESTGLAGFDASISQTALGQLGNIAHEASGLLALPAWFSNETAVLDALVSQKIAQSDTLLFELQEAVSAQDSAAIHGQLEGLKTDILTASANLRLLEDSLRNQFSTATNTLLLLNASVSPTNLQEDNEQFVNQIRFESIVNQVFLPDSAQKAQIRAIAALCPTEGGYAVYPARGMVASFDGEYLFPTDCETTAIQRNGQTDKPFEKAARFEVSPIPANDRVFIKDNRPEWGQSRILIQDANGKTVFDEKSDSGLTGIRTSSFAAGLYFIRIFGVNEAEPASFKAIISH